MNCREYDNSKSNFQLWPFSWPLQIELTVAFSPWNISKLNDNSRFWHFVYLYSPFLPETSVGLEECSAFFNSSTASTRPIFQGHFDLPQNHNPSSPFYSAPACCLQPCECCDSVKQISQNRLYGSLFPPAFPRIFKPRCVSSNMAYVPVTSGLETFAIPPQQPADLPVSVKAETDWWKTTSRSCVCFFQCLAENRSFEVKFRNRPFKKGIFSWVGTFCRISSYVEFRSIIRYLWKQLTFLAYWFVWLRVFYQMMALILSV